MTRLPRLVAVGLFGLLVCGCSEQSGQASGLGDGATAAVQVSLSADDRYANAMDQAAGLGLAVWVETDLVKAWRNGARDFARTAARVRLLADRRGVVGVKIADELGYRDGLDDSPDRVRTVLRDAAAAMRVGGKRRPVLVDLVVPELGCAPGIRTRGEGAARCRAAARSGYKALRLEEVDRLLAGGDVDVVNLSTSMLSGPTYEEWGIDRDSAQRAAWHEIARRGWAGHVRLHARKALAHPGAYVGDPTADLTTFVSIPREAGAAAVDIWTWRQRYQGQIVQLTDPGGATNALWSALRQRHVQGVPLLTHFTPSSVHVSVATDLRMLSQAFTGLFVAAGTG